MTKSLNITDSSHDKKNKSKNDVVSLIFIGLIIVLNEYCFFLVDVNKINMHGSFNYNDIPLFLCIVWAFYVWNKYDKKYLNIKKSRNIMIITILAVFISSLRSMYLYDQSLIMGLRPQRLFIILIFMSIPASMFFNADNKNIKLTEKLIYILSVIELTLCVMQYFLYDKFIFLSVTQSMRNNSIRLHFESSLLKLFLFLVVNNIIKKKYIKFNFFILIILTFFNLFVIKGRANFFASLISILLIVILCKKNLLIKIPVIICIMISSIFIVKIPSINYYFSFFNYENRLSDHNYEIRVEAKKYYREQLKKSPILGRGYINILNKKALRASGDEKGYYLIDNGITGFVFMYGFCGVLWLIIIFGQCLIGSVRILKEKENYFYIGYTVFLIILSPNILESYWEFGPMYIVMILCSLEAQLMVSS